jgi:hypothetical protein
MARAASWLSDLRNLTRFYLVAGLCLVPWGVVYALADAWGWKSPTVGYGLFAGGIATAILVWSRLEHSRPIKAEVKNLPIQPFTGTVTLSGEVTFRVIRARSGVYVTAKTSGSPTARQRVTGKVMNQSRRAATARGRYGRAEVLLRH